MPNEMTEEERKRRQLDANKAPPGKCAYCDELRERGETFHPPHRASARCRSGRHDHCTCDTCF